jgi:shikimate dehydrogenase
MSEPDRFLMAGIMGRPVMHSGSPRLHNYWLEKHGIAGRYMPLAIKPDAIEKALRALPALGFSGCNLTMPHKETAVSLMDVYRLWSRRSAP